MGGCSSKEKKSIVSLQLELLFLKKKVDKLNQELAENENDLSDCFECLDKLNTKIIGVENKINIGANLFLHKIQNVVEERCKEQSEGRVEERSEERVEGRSEERVEGRNEERTEGQVQGRIEEDF